MSAKNEKYITIYEWMNDLDLSPVEKIAYALVYSFCKKGECFSGKNSYLQEWLGCSSKHTTIGVMRSLEEKGLIVREQQMVNGKASNVYMLGAEIAPKGCKKCTGGVQKLHERGAKIAPNNNNDINNDNIVVVEEAHVHAHEKVLEWITDNQVGLEQMLLRNGLVTQATSVDEMKEIIRPYAKEYYEQQLMNGGDDIERRGRRDIKQHFAAWLPIRIKKIQQEQTQKLKDYETNTDPITRAMQQLAAGMESARLRKEQSDECL